MLREKVGIYLRITTPKGKRFVRPHLTRDGYIFNAEGKAERRPDGVYYLRYEHNGKRKWEKLGCCFMVAQKLRKLREAELENGVFATPAKATKKTPKPLVLTLEAQRDKFLERKRLTKKQDGTALDKETIAKVGTQVLAAC